MLQRTTTQHNTILLFPLGGGVGNLDTANEMYLTLSKKMFGNTSLIGGASRLVWTHSYYDTEAWERLLQENLGDFSLTQCNRNNSPKVSVTHVRAAKRKDYEKHVTFTE